MAQEIQKVESTNVFKKLNYLKDIIFIVLGASYFYLLEISNYQGIKNFLEDNLGSIFVQVISAVIFFFLALGILGLGIFLIKKVCTKIVSTTKTNFDNALLDESIKFLTKNKYIISAYFSTFFISFGDQISSYINKGFLTLLLFLCIIFLSQIFSLFFDNVVVKNRKFKFLNKSLATLTKKGIIVCIWIFGIITILSNLGFNVTALIAGAGIGGLAFAFAAQKSIANIFGAITILMNKPIRIGDFVCVNGITGTVRDLGLSYITITEQNGHQVMVPNETIISSNVENFSIRDTRRADFSIGLVYGTSIEKMKKGVKIIEEILETEKNQDEILNYRVNFDMFGDFSLNINITYFSLITDTYVDFLKQKENINLQIKEIFEKEGLDMAFPTQELIIQK